MVLHSDLIEALIRKYLSDHSLDTDDESEQKEIQMNESTSVPRYLYKYRAPNERTLSILEKEKIWAPTFKNLNDPFDGRIRFAESVSEEELEEYSFVVQQRTGCTDVERKSWFCGLLDESGKVRPDKQKSIVSVLRASTEDTFSKFGVVCLSEHSANMLMWTHYCDEHKGICIEFENTLGSLISNPKACLKVRYTEAYPIVSCLDYAITKNSEAIKKTHFTKAMAWQYEDEWRYIEEGGDKPCELPGKISAIIFGLNAQPEFVEKVKSVTAQKGVIYKHASLSEKSYRLIVQ